MDNDKQTLSENEIADYLIAHPDFLLKNPHVLEKVQLASAPEGSISLVQRQIARLTDKNNQTQEQLRTLIDNARQNNILQTRVHSLCLRLMDAPSVEALVSLLVSELKREFKADEVALRLFYNDDDVRLLPEITENIVQVHRDDASLKAFEHVLTQLKPVCGRLSIAQKTLLFGEHVDSVQSVACLPLGQTVCEGLLAIASYDQNRFHADMATDYLRFLADVVSRLLNPFMAPKPS